ncbi:PefC/AfrB family outer membrane usher protein, partial [Aeromonas hydrophila]|nr:PefC/AfrB family outer membrane usher protein [Aeromonas hydrophila]
KGLDMTFVHGGGEAWALLDGRYVPGRYLVELSVNGADAGRHILDVTQQDAEVLCLTQSWLTKVGVNIDPDFFREGYDAARQCWVLTNAPGARVDFDVSTQSLELSIPQKGLRKQSENVAWDYGTHAFRVNYSANANTGRHDTSVFGSADLKANVERWVVSSSATANGGSSGGNQTSIEMFTASRSLQEWSSDLEVGKTSTGDSLLGSTGTYGVALSRNNSMKPGRLGYSPVFSGVATTPSRVTLTQSNRIVYSEMVPPGPFAITDVSLFSSGDVTMSVTGDDGQASTQIFPLSVVSGQLSPGADEFSVAAGMPDDDSKLGGGVFAASYGYGLDDMTLRTGTVLSQKWQGISVGGVVGMGTLGAMSIDGMHAAATYQDGGRSGNKVKLAWNKQLTQTGTGLRVSGSRQDKEYEELSSFEPDVSLTRKGDYRRLQDEWNVGVSQPIVGLFNLSLSGWQRSYYPRTSVSAGRDAGISGTLSTQIKQVSLNVGASASQGQQGDSWAVSASVSVPFSFLKYKYSSNTSLSSNKGGAVGVSTGVSGSLNDRFSYAVGGGNNGGGGVSNYANAAYAADSVFLSSMLNHSVSGGTSGSISASGSMLAVPAAEGIMFSRTGGDTVAVVSVKGTSGVKVSSGGHLASDAGGNLVVPLNSYDWNTVTIDAGSLPINTELSQTSQQVVPSDGAVIWMPFEPLIVRRYILQVRQQDGAFVPGGTWARDSKGTPLGFVANNGVLMINTVDAPGELSLGGCRILADKLQETERLQEIMCD